MAFVHERASVDTMITAIVREGESLGVILDDEVMNLAQLQPGDEVDVEVQADGTIRITPIRPARAEGSTD